MRGELLGGKRGRWGGGHFLPAYLALLFLLSLFFLHTMNMPEQQQHNPTCDALGRPWCQAKALETEQQFFDYFSNLEYDCLDLRGYGEGSKNKDGLKYACHDPGFGLIPGNCTVLSFGINYEWNFEDDIANFGCKVHAFDPTMKQLNHRRSVNVFFYRMGIGNVRGKRLIGMDTSIDYFWVDRYENILQNLGLTASPVHYLKMDVELSELEFLQDVLRNSPHLLANVRQLAIELHHGYKGEGVLGEPPAKGPLSPTSTFTLFWQHMQDLRCLGFRLMHVRENGPWREVLWGRPVSPGP